MISWFEAGAATHVGKVRDGNEDNYLVHARSGLWAVADGMGGHLSGELASGIVVEELQTVPTPASAAELLASCEEHLVAANGRLRELSRERNGTIGSTVVVLLVYDRHYACVWAGDSRIYRVRAGAIEQATVDHTEVQELIAAGSLTAEEARTWPRRNVITHAIGVADDPEIEMVHGGLMPGDTFVLCSDGLTAHVDDDEILAAVIDAEPKEACDTLVALTLERGAADNVTVLVVRYDLMAPAAADTGAWE